MDNLLADILVFATMCSVCAQIPPGIPSPPPAAGDGSSDYLDLRPDGGFRFGYNTGDFGQHQHAAVSSPDGRVAGRYSERGRQTIYTAGPRGFRARGTHIARRMDLSQNRIPYNPPVSPDSPAYQPTYSGYHDPNEDPSYSFGFRTPTYSRQETSNRNAEVTGQYSYLDDVGERHHVDYIAGSRTGFHVKTPFPDSLPFSGSLFVHTPGKPGQKARGRTAIQRGLDGSYRFTAAGPDQRRVEVSDATGHVRGSYTYLDDKGVQRTTEYIAGPNIGYKVINSKKGPLPSLYPYLTPTFPPALPPPKGISGRPIPLDDVFDPPEGLTTAETGPGVKPPKKGRPNSDESIEDMSLPSDSTGVDAGKPSKDDTSSGSGDDDFLLSISDINGGYEKPTSSYGSSEEPSGKPDNDGDDDLFGKPGGGYQRPGSGYGKPGGGITKPNKDGGDLFGGSPEFDTSTKNGYASSGGGYSKSDDQSSSLSSSSGSEDSVDDDLFGNPTNGFFKPTMGGGMVIGKKHKPGPTYTEIDDIYRPTPTPFDQIGVTTTNSGSPGSKTGGATDTKNTDGRIKVLFGNCCSVPSRGSIKHQKPTLKPTIVPPQLTSASYSNVRDFSYNHDGQALVSYHGTRDSYVGFPPGVAVRAHVQSLDILPYGHRLPSPTVALEQHSAGQGRRSSDSQQF